MGTSSSDRRQRSRNDEGDNSRGQTTLDFAIGISIFLAVVLFIFVFIPGILSPFTASAQDKTVSADRVADRLSKGMLASPAEPHVLDEYCTKEFFKNEGSNTGCGFSNEQPVEQQVGVSGSFQNVNVTIRGNVSSATSDNDILCWDTDGDDTGLVEKPNCDYPATGGNDVPLTRGATPSSSASTVTSTRIVSLDGTDVTMRVEVW